MAIPWLAIGTGVSIISDLWGGYKKKQSLEQGGELARDAAYANASDLLGLGGINAGAIVGAASNTAGSILRVGEANAQAVERATARNLMLYGMQADEEVRRHVRAEKMNAGSIRAMVGAGGVQTNTGTPLYYLNNQIEEGLVQRQFMQNKHLQTMWTMEQEGADKAHIYRLTAGENASVIMANAELQAQVTLAEAQARSDAMRRSGDVAYEGGQIAGDAAMWGGLSSALTTGIGGFASGAFNFGGTSPMSINQGFAQNLGMFSNTGFGSGMQGGFAAQQGWGNSSTFGLNQPVYNGWSYT